MDEQKRTERCLEAAAEALVSLERVALETIQLAESVGLNPNHPGYQRVRLEISRAQNHLKELTVRLGVTLVETPENGVTVAPTPPSGRNPIPADPSSEG